MSHDIFEPKIDKYPADIWDVVDNYLLHFLKILVLKQRLPELQILSQFILETKF